MQRPLPSSTQQLSRIAIFINGIGKSVLKLAGSSNITVDADGGVSLQPPLDGLLVPMQLYRSTKAALATLPSTGNIGLLVWTTDTQELYTDSGAGVGIGPGNAYLRAAANTHVTVAADLAARLALTNQLLGDICVQTDTVITYMLTSLPSSVDGNWSAI